MITRIHLLGAWSGIIYLTLFFVGFWPLAHFLPGHDPLATAQAISGLYQGNTTGIRLGMLLLLVGSMFFLPWNVTLAAIIKRMEGESTFLSQCQLTGAVASAMFLFIPSIFWEITAFRPDRAPELTLMLNDASWLLLITAVPPFVLQSAPLGLAILMDKSKEPFFPRWFGFATLWGDVTYLPGSAAFFFKSGPFAWNNIFPYWVPFITYGTWVLVLSIMMFRIINREAPRAATQPAGSMQPAE